MTPLSAIYARLSRIVREIEARWTAFSVRERWLIAVLGAVGMIVLLFYGVVRPLHEVRVRALREIATYDALNARLAALDPDSAAQAQEQRSGQPDAIAAEVAEEAGITPDRIGADGAGVRVILSQTPFERVTQWISTVESTSALRVKTLRITRAGTPGYVTADIMVAP